MNRTLRSDRAFYLLITSVLCCIILAAGGRSISIDRRGIVHAMGIDPCEKGYRVSLQIFQPAGSGSDTAVDVTGANVAVAVSEGKTVSEALSAAGSSAGKELFFGHLQLICLGSDIPLDDPTELFAFALGSKNISPSADICMAQGKAEDLMQLKLTEDETSAEALSSLITTSAEYSRTLSCDLKSLLSEEGNAAMPVLEVISEGDTDSSSADSPSISQSVRVEGTAVITREGKILLTENASLSAALLSGKANKGSIVTILDGESVTSELDNCHRHRTITIKNGRLILRTNITISSRPDHELDPEQSKKLSDVTASALESDCTALQSEMFQRGADIFGTSQLIKQHFPKLWLKYRDAPEKLLSAVEAHVNITVKVV
ncbi:Ger(x)C family spore germination C-terminal domain-containing protein [Ruminococcus albus]|uniref:Germination protein, Ger(X)C family n=1 Tax=Ruminococcus albus TaxID=1264 RepID=A0A1I1QMD7_RUMAL|nr:Ger(x)C family spore germination C-terminal domain-containing protein [Ruminococcus albus]SFD23195.1 germination protein, Ger(x)C family [Ruminococcus albus]